MRTLPSRGARSTTPSWTALMFAAAVGGWATALGGCAAAPQITSEALPHETFRLKCKTSLPRCLDRAEYLCHGYRYTVVRAVDVHDYMGSQGSVGESEFRSSEAVFRCGSRGKALWGSDVDPMAEVQPTPPPSAQAPVAVATKACVRGATQECTGPAACRGGQSCLPDGSGYSACDCGAITSNPASAVVLPGRSATLSNPPSGRTPPSAVAPPVPALVPPATKP